MTDSQHRPSNMRTYRNNFDTIFRKPSACRWCPACKKATQVEFLRLALGDDESTWLCPTCGEPYPGRES